MIEPETPSRSRSEERSRLDALRRIESASSMVLRFRRDLCADISRPVLDLGCGYGRNAVPLAGAGVRVVCADSDEGRLAAIARYAIPHLVATKGIFENRLHLLCADLSRENWPFKRRCFSAVLCVHVVCVELIDAIDFSLNPGGYLLIEMFGGHGQNYLQLPKPGALPAMLSERFDCDATWKIAPLATRGTAPSSAS